MKYWLADLLQDARFAARMLAKRPGFAAAAVLTLGLGIGAATAVFSVVDAALLRPLPYKDPGRLVVIWDRFSQQNAAAIFASFADYDTFRTRARSFESAAAATWAPRGRASRVLTGRGPAVSVLAIPATAGFFDMLGTRAALGRTFHPGDETSGCAVVLAHSFWTSKLGADAALIGQSLTLDGKPCSVLGVMPPEFVFYPHQTQMWMLLGPDFDVPRDQVPVLTFARLKPGVTLQQAQAEASALHRALHQGDKERDIQPLINPLHDAFAFLASRTLRATLSIVFAAVGMLLLIACLNLSNLLLGRLAERHRELAVRAALGSGRSRLVRQVLTEGLLLSLAGAAAGVALAFAAARYFNAANPIELTVGGDVRVNLPVLLFSGALAIAATLIFGLLPALQVSRVDITEKLRAAGRGAVHAGFRFNGAKTMIAVEAGASVLLLSAASLLLTSALQMGSADLGFDPHGLIATRIAPPAAKYSDPVQRAAFYQRILERVKRLPGVTGASMASAAPPYMGGGGGQLEIQGRAPLERAPHDIGADWIGESYLEVLKTRVIRGRAFDKRDAGGAAPVAIVNQALADEYFSHSDPLGQQVRLKDVKMPWLTIVGVAGNLKHTEMMSEMKWMESPALFRPLAQEPPPAATLVVRAAQDAPDLGRKIQQAVSSEDSDAPLGDGERVDAAISKTLEYPRFRAAVLSLFAMGALLLSAIGLHGVLAQIVAQRTAEFGVRRAVGAQTRDLLVLVAKQGGIPVLAGLVCGVAAAVAGSRVLAGLLYGSRPADPKLLAAASLILLAAAAAAMAAPAWRAARVDPMTALRTE